MNKAVQVENINDVERRISIHVAPDVVDKKFDEFFNSIKKDAQIPGFRKGKVPVSMLKKHYKGQAAGAISQMLISEFYQNAIKKYNINPVGNPTVKNQSKDAKYIGEFNDDNSYSVEMWVEVLPEVDPVGYDDLIINLPERDIDEMCQSRLSEYQDQFAEREQITDAGAAEGDSVVIDFKGFVNGEAFKGGEANNFTIDNLGNNTLIPGFEEQLFGLKSGESKRIQVTFPDPYSAEHLAGKEAEFDVTIHNIVRKTRAEVDEDLALMAGFESVEALQEGVKEEVLKEVEKSDRQFVEAVISAQLIEKNPFDVPQTLVRQEMERLLKINSVSNPDDALKAQVNEAAIKNVKKALILEAIYEKEDDVKVSPEQLNEFLEEQAELHGKTKDDIVSLLYGTNQMESFFSVLKVKNVVDYIKKINTESE